MEALLFFLGLITGMVVSTLLVVLNTRYQNDIQRTQKQITSKLKQKGSILEPENEQLDYWLKSLKNE